MHSASRRSFIVLEYSRVLEPSIHLDAGVSSCPPVIESLADCFTQTIGTSFIPVRGSGFLFSDAVLVRVSE